MRLVKFLLLTITAVLVTGCYTQLQYTRSQSAENERYESAEEEYIPLDYRDYEYAERYKACDCNPYRSYSSFYFAPDWNYHSFYGPHWGRMHYRPFFSSHYWALSPHMRWRMRTGFGYHHNHFGFSLSWGSPFYHSFYGSSFYYDPYWYAYHRPLAYNYYNFYGSGYYRNVFRDDRDYRRRSIGTSRIQDNDRRRSRSAANDRSRVRSRSSDSSTNTPSVRRRSSGSSRTDNGSVGRTRSRSNSSGSVGRSRGGRSSSSSGNSSGGRSRSGGNNSLQSSIDVRSSDTSDRVGRSGFLQIPADRISRTRSGNSARSENNASVRRQLRSSDRQKSDRRDSRGGFLERLRKVFDIDRSNISERIQSAVRSRSGDRSRSSIRSDRSKPSINSRSSRSKSRSTVRQSRSSSSSDSRASSRSSRSRSGGRN